MITGGTSRNGTARVLAGLALMAVTACGPVPVQQAERQCLEQARLAEAPQGQIWVGGNSAGQAQGGAEITISSDFILGRDPSQVFDECVMRRSGQRPTRSLIDQPKQAS